MLRIVGVPELVRPGTEARVAPGVAAAVLARDRVVRLGVLHQAVPVVAEAQPARVVQVLDDDAVTHALGVLAARDLLVVAAGLRELQLGRTGDDVLGGNQVGLGQVVVDRLADFDLGLRGQWPGRLPQLNAQAGAGFLRRLGDQRVGWRQAGGQQLGRSIGHQVALRAAADPQPHRLQMGLGQCGRAARPRLWHRRAAARGCSQRAGGQLGVEEALQRLAREHPLRGHEAALGIRIDEVAVGVASGQVQASLLDAGAVAEEVRAAVALEDH